MSAFLAGFHCARVVSRNFQRPFQHYSLLKTVYQPWLSHQPNFRSVHMTPPTSGMFDGIRSKMNDMRQETDDARNQKAFEAQMKYLTDETRPIDANVYLDTVEDLKKASGISGFREHLPWVNNSPILNDIKREQLILNSLTEHDRQYPGRVTIAAKKRLSRAIDVDLAEIETLLERVVMMRDVQRWIVKRKFNEEYLPQTNIELQNMISMRGSGFKQTKLYKRSPFPNPGVKQKKSARYW